MKSKTGVSKPRRQRNSIVNVRKGFKTAVDTFGNRLEAADFSGPTHGTKYKCPECDAIAYLKFQKGRHDKNHFCCPGGHNQLGSMKCPISTGFNRELWRKSADRIDFSSYGNGRITQVASTTRQEQSGGRTVIKRELSNGDANSNRPPNLLTEVCRSLNEDEQGFLAQERIITAPDGAEVPASQFFVRADKVEDSMVGKYVGVYGDIRPLLPESPYISFVDTLTAGANVFVKGFDWKDRLSKLDKSKGGFVFAIGKVQAKTKQSVTTPFVVTVASSLWVSVKL